MKLNLAILAEDLKDYAFHKSIRHPHAKCLLEFGGIPGELGLLENNIAFVVDAKELDAMHPNRFKLIPSMICIGRPGEEYLSAEYCNVIWTEVSISVASLLNRVNERFRVYDKWMLSLEQAVARCEPAKVLGELSLDIMGKPIWMWDRHYQTIFHCAGFGPGGDHENYVFHKEHTPWPVWEINAWKDSGLIDIEATQREHKPYILPNTDLFDYRALAYNIFFGDEYAATVTLDEVESPITERDYVLIQYLGDVLCQELKRSEYFNISISKHMVTILERLLANEHVPDSQLVSVLSPIGWSDTGPFVCAVVKPASPYYSLETIIATAEMVCSDLGGGVLFVMDGQEIVFVINARHIEGSPLDMAGKVFQSLAEHQYKMTMGVSTEFLKLKDLPDYRQQAADAIDVGIAKRHPNDPHPQASNDCYYFEDHVLDFIIDKCCTRVLPETLCPPGLLALIEYDRANGTEFCITLREFLDNNMQVSETARRMFMHRNSLIKQLAKIRKIIKIDLDDPNARLMLSCAFRMLEGRCDVIKRAAPPPLSINV